MKNKLFLIGLAVLLVMAFTACQNGVQDVRMKLDQPNEVAAVTATLTTAAGTKYVILTWDAVENVSSYYVYYKVDGSKSTVSSGNGSNRYVYAAADGTRTDNTDPDKWSYIITASGNNSDLIPGKSIIFGVRTQALVTTTQSTNSDIVWSNAITTPAAP
jgi:hypothetical protein